MQARASSGGADRAINKFGWAAIILAVGVSAAAIIAAIGATGWLS
ncbi:hypothetical protein [Thiothrix winogradskyi]|nr:hypothetical protein [Thiothrix winogradskyi]